MAGKPTDIRCLRAIVKAINALDSESNGRDVHDQETVTAARQQLLSVLYRNGYTVTVNRATDKFVLTKKDGR